MVPSAALLLAEIILVIHMAVVIFNVGAMVVIPVGGALGWRFVRILWWRVLHLALMAVVAIQALLGRACFLTLWQDNLQAAAGGAVAHRSMFPQWITTVLYWPLELWVFAILYAVALAYCVALWFLIPPTRTGEA